jgi:hypothetical protein
MGSDGFLGDFSIDSPFVDESCRRRYKTKKAPHFFDAFVMTIRHCIALNFRITDTKILVTGFFVKKKMFEFSGDFNSLRSTIESESKKGYHSVTTGF